MIKVLLFDFYGVLLNQETDSLDEEILEYLKTVKGKFELAIFTSALIQNDPEVLEKLNPIFSKIYSSFELAINKKDKSSYEFIASDLKVKPEEILFIDDTEFNIIAAKEAGLKTHHYKNNEELLEYLKSLNA